MNPEHSLYEASKTLLKYRFHRLPIIDIAESNTILHIITHSRILLFLMEKVLVPKSFNTDSIFSSLKNLVFFHIVLEVLELEPIKMWLLY